MEMFKRDHRSENILCACPDHHDEGEACNCDDYPRVGGEDPPSFTQISTNRGTGIYARRS